MAVQKLHEFCEAEKRKILIRFEKDNSTRKNSQKNYRLAKYICYIEISLNTSFFKELIPKQQRKKHVH